MTDVRLLVNVRSRIGHGLQIHVQLGHSESLKVELT